VRYRLLSGQTAIRLQIVVDGAAGLLRQLASDEIEFAICSREASPIGEEHEITPICHLPLALLARGGHSLAGRRVSKQEALAFPLLGGSTSERGEAQAVRYAPNLACDNYEILRGLTLTSDALWMASPAVAVEELANGRMIAVNCPDLVRATYEVVMVKRRRRTQSPAAALVAGRLADALVGADLRSAD
jgi:DNA-binding transcriptional LysR family regulator